MADIFKYLIHLNPTDPAKVLNSYSETLTEEVLINIFYKRYAFLQDVDLYDTIIERPCLIHNHLVNIY